MQENSTVGKMEEKLKVCTFKRNKLDDKVQMVLYSFTFWNCDGLKCLNALIVVL